MYGGFFERHKEDQREIFRSIHAFAEQAYIEGRNEGLRQEHFENSNEYDKGLEDAWECARKINNMTMEECEEVFGEYRYFGTVVENYTAAEVIEKLKEHEAKHTDKGCDSCKYEDEPEFTSPCVDCSRNHKDMWEAKR